MDGERIEGTWRHAFVRNHESYFLSDLLIYADGTVDCHGLMTLEEFTAKVCRSEVTIDPPDGARAIGPGLTQWRFTAPRAAMTSDDFLGEVRDEVDWLNGRPGAEARCMAAVDAFLSEPTEDNRAILRAAYEAVPRRLHLYAFTGGEGSYKGPDVRILAAGPGNRIDRGAETEVVTGEMHAEAVQYLARLAPFVRTSVQAPAADGPVEPAETSVVIGRHFEIDSVSYPISKARPPHVMVLRNEYPAPITVGESACPTVMHAYWALSVADENQQAEILRAENAGAAQHLAAGLPRHDHWPQARTAIMASLVRAKFAQHPELAEVLTATGATRLIYEDAHAGFWGQNGQEGRNWMGRLLELIRSELAANGMTLKM